MTDTQHALEASRIEGSAAAGGITQTGPASEELGAREPSHMLGAAGGIEAPRGVNTGRRGTGSQKRRAPSVGGATAFDPVDC